MEAGLGVEWGDGVASTKCSELGWEMGDCYVITVAFLIGKNLFPSSGRGRRGGETKDRLEKSVAMGYFSLSSCHIFAAYKLQR